MGLVKTIITCFVALLGVTNWLILRRLFEDEKLGITHGAEGMHLPQLGPESAAVTSHLQGGWVSWLGPHSRSGLASRRGVKSICSTHHQGQAKRPGKSVLCCAVLCCVGQPKSGDYVSLAFAWFNRPLNSSARRAVHVGMSVKILFPGNYLGKCFSHSSFL